MQIKPKQTLCIPSTKLTRVKWIVCDIVTLLCGEGIIIRIALNLPNSFMDPKWVGSLKQTLKATNLQAKEAINLTLSLSQTQNSKNQRTTTTLNTTN